MKWIRRPSAMEAGPAGVGLLMALGPVTARSFRSSNNGRRLARNRKFVDSPLEGTGFELPVRGRGQSGCRPFYATESSGIDATPSGTESLQTHRWREVDSNPRSPYGGWRLGLLPRSYGKCRGGTSRRSISLNGRQTNIDRERPPQLSLLTL